MQKEEIPTVQEQTVTDKEEIIMTAQVQATEDRTDRTVREDLRVKEDPREDVLAREETRAKETVREDLRAREDPREITAREDVSDREDPRAMEIVREDVSDREDHREMETVREEDRRAMARVVRTETEVKDVTDASAAVRDVRDSARIQERMTIWHLHRN